eukprot:196447-Rhodomonas_salina.1
MDMYRRNLFKKPSHSNRAYSRTTESVLVERKDTTKVRTPVLEVLFCPYAYPRTEIALCPYALPWCLDHAMPLYTLPVLSALCSYV